MLQKYALKSDISAPPLTASIRNRPWYRAGGYRTQISKDADVVTVQVNAPFGQCLGQRANIGPEALAVEQHDVGHHMQMRGTDTRA